MQSAQAEAINQGLSGRLKSNFVDNFMKNPPAKALEQASKDAQYATLQQKTALGQAASGLQKKLGPLGHFIAPFTRMPGAAATDLINYSPVGAVKTVIQNIGKGKFDQRDLAMGLGRATTGTAIMAVGAALMSAGRMTGEYPTNKDQQAQWQLEGKQANSILVNGKWQSIGSLGPFADALLAGGQASEGAQKNGTTGAISQGTAGGLKAITNQPYLQGLSGAMNAINTPSQATSFLDQSAGSLIPVGVKQLAVATDPYQRQTTAGNPLTSIKNSVTNGIPILDRKSVV